ncbi:site-specific integrase [Dietzia kunjamensis]|uniref:site-specific integrase n=1 Tax=Dietzia kunjamensis TaxID=322509 RepID=UPI00388FE498
MREGGDESEPERLSYCPDYLLPIIRELEARYERFDELRKQVLLPYGYNTARAYWGDLDDVFMWAEERDKDVLALTVQDLRQYVALLRRRKYSESTIRRRITAMRKLYDVIGLEPNPADAVVIRRGDKR